jgi:pyrimidine operon attenuation protein/uracil phosphoribosyltransferase
MMTDLNIDQFLGNMVGELEELLDKNECSDPLMIGIQTGGVWIGEQLRQRTSIESPLGELNIAFYRDDFSRIGLHPRVSPSSLPFDIENKHIILVDDVLHTGRTIRAALNEIFDFGRPASVSLVVLIERSGQELPIRADIVGKRISLNTNEHVKLCGPEPLALEIKTVE